MPNEYVTQLLDPVYGAADITKPSEPLKLRVSVTDDGPLIHAFLGGLYLAMTERNWAILFNAIQQVDVPVTTTHYIRMDDATGTATIKTVTT